jgi:hypothetical protein
MLQIQYILCKPDIVETYVHMNAKCRFSPLMTGIRLRNLCLKSATKRQFVHKIFLVLSRASPILLVQIWNKPPYKGIQTKDWQREERNVICCNSTSKRKMFGQNIH